MSTSAWLSYISMSLLILATIFIVIGYSSPWWYYDDPATSTGRATIYYGLWSVRSVISLLAFSLIRNHRECVKRYLTICSRLENKDL